MPYYLIVRTNKPTGSKCEDRAEDIKRQLQGFDFVRKEPFSLFRVRTTESCTITFFFETEPPSGRRELDYPRIVEKHFEVGRDVEISAVIHERTFKARRTWRSLTGQPD